jgi:hypothetical protein
MKVGHTSATRSAVLRLGRSFGVCVAALVAFGCSSSASPDETGAPVGVDPNAGGQNFGGQAGSVQGNGGFQQGNGGFQQGNGGFQQGNGGFQQGSGGFQQGTGGVEQGGGGFQNTGGIQGTGGGGTQTSPPCLTNASEGVIIGDSYVTGALSPALQPALAALNPFANGFRNYAVAGTSMATGGLTGLIPPQWDQAVAANPDIKFGIMDGGGNDILICDVGKFPSCNTICKSPGSSTNAMCKDIVAQAVAAAEALMKKAAGQGLQDVIYFFYPHLPGTNTGYKEITDYAEPFAKASCDNAPANTGGKLHCFFVDLVAPFAAAGGDANPANFVSDSIHPSQAGQNIIAKEINNVMQKNCLGMQNGCCTP